MDGNIGGGIVLALQAIWASWQDGSRLDFRGDRPNSDHRLVARCRSCDAATAKQIVWAASSTPMPSG